MPTHNADTARPGKPYGWVTLDRDEAIVKKADLKLVLDAAAEKVSWDRGEWMAFKRLTKAALIDGPGSADG